MRLYIVLIGAAIGTGLFGANWRSTRRYVLDAQTRFAALPDLGSRPRWASCCGEADLSRGSRWTNVLRKELRFRGFLLMKLEQRASKAEHTNIN